MMNKPPINADSSLEYSRERGRHAARSESGEPEVLLEKTAGRWIASESGRRWVMSVAASIAALLILLDVFTQDVADGILSVIAAILFGGSTTLAAVNVRNPVEVSISTPQQEVSVNTDVIPTTHVASISLAENTSEVDALADALEDQTNTTTLD